MPKEWVKPLWFLFTVGWYVALSLVLPTALGYWLDTRVLDTSPLFALLGFALGTVVAFYGLYRMLRRFMAEYRDQDRSIRKGDSQKK